QLLHPRPKQNAQPRPLPKNAAPAPAHSFAPRGPRACTVGVRAAAPSPRSSLASAAGPPPRPPPDSARAGRRRRTARRRLPARAAAAAPPAAAAL
ncbi:MAG: hypothetical protein J3K34DRAFT_373867, partial [Monoraphidium minutum]